MRTVRIIPRLDIKGPNLVKGIHLEGLRVLGKPEEFSNHYYEEGADELIYMDVVASLYQRNSLKDIITLTASKTFIPLAVGGGLRTIEDIREALRAGADKVSINTAAIKNPQIIKEAALVFGSSTIVVAIEAIKQPDGEYLAFTDNGREYTGVEVTEWAKKIEELGAGEIIITSVDREGTGLGYDIELTKKITTVVNIPVIAHGGAGNCEDIYKVIVDGGADAVCIASMLHYGYIKNKEIKGNYEKEGNIEFLKSGNTFGRVTPTSITEIKKYLSSKGIPIRLTQTS